ncbi:PREDICTED: transcription factor Adf-1-like [Amphimedon queenslandica]|uniref:MADF domain-containing protein n=1 Tax=Amphimedon queenslandica TaxID=400682 RepID=A0A1X7TVH4_AMPQE|nr:PREDICTED: transcription factor Adf-1-like [Amphimedon queenslandica]|eukprot:XP_011406710.1 PREDICTED: transcription factor Adf-1-like [Amphimedon queenslandica]
MATPEYTFEDKDEKFINLVREYPCLWNMKLKEYKDGRLKENSWDIVAKEVKLSVADCKKKWKSLRDRYVRECKGIRRPTGTGGPPPKSHWSYFTIMSFIKDTVRHRKTESNIPECGEEEESEIIQEDHSEDQVLPTKETNYSQEISPIFVPSPNSQSLSNMSSPSTSVSTFKSPLKKKAKKEQVDAVFIETLKTISSGFADSRGTHGATGKDVDDDYHFVMQILGNLKRLDNPKRAMAKVYILQYLTSIEYDIPIQPPVSSIDIN